MDCKLQVPYGILCLTLLYLAFVLPIAFLSPVECLDGPCNSEGLDNSVLGWATDFLVALLMALFGLHLLWFAPQPVFYSAVIALVSMGIAYVLGGIGHSIYSKLSAIELCCDCKLTASSRAAFVLAQRILDLTTTQVNKVFILHGQSAFLS